METCQNDSEPQTDNGKDPRTGKFLPGHKPYIIRGNESGLRGRPSKEDWEWARSQKPAVLKALVNKAIKGHHPSIELYLAYVDGRPIQEFKTTNLSVNVSAEDIKELAEKIEAHRLDFLRELGIGATQAIDGPACTPVVVLASSAAQKPETRSP